MHSGQCLNSEIMAFFLLAANVDAIISEKKKQLNKNIPDVWTDGNTR